MMLSSNALKISGIVIILALTFALGRYSVKQPPAVKIDQTTQTQTETKKDQDTHKHTQTTEVKQPDGTTTTTTDTTEDTVTHTDTQRDKDVVTHESITPAPPRKTLNVSALVSMTYHRDLTRDSTTPAYGLSISKEFIGPVTLGAFGLTNGVLGLSVGLNF